MDGVVEAAPQLGAWASIRGFFTPATLFLVVNLVIGTIALTSRATQQRRRRDRERYYQYYHDDGHLHDPLHPHMQPQQEYHQQQHYYPQEQAMYAPPPPLARTSSVLDRLRSFGLYRFRSGDFPPEYGAAAGPPNQAHDAFAPVVESEQPHYARSRSEPAPQPPAREERRPAARASKPGSEVRRSQAARAPVVQEAVAEKDDYVGARAAEETVVGSFRREPSPLQQEYHGYQEEKYQYVPPVRAPAAPALLQRTSSVLDRLRSLGLYGFLAPEQPAAASIPATLAVAGEKQQAHYDMSRSEPAREQQGGKKEKKQEAKTRMAKSSSAARKAAAPSLTAAGEGVDARAEAFIDSFRQQQVQHHREQEEYVPPPAPLTRTSSVLDRLRSFGLYRFRSGDLGPDDLPAAAAETHTPAAEEKKKHEAQYGRSRSEPAREQGKREPRMSKSSSSVVEEEEHEADHGVDARADDFINKFRQQLQLQRLNSLLNYKEMLGRGGAAGKQ